MPTPVEMPETGLPFTGAVGQVIAAVLQTAGVYSQSEILKNFSTFFDSLGVLFVIASMMGGIASVVFFSAYKRGLMLLLCPFLFMFVMKTTVTGRPTIVRIGERFTSATDSQFQSVLQEWLINKNNAAPQVSLVYVLFDSAVSSVMQSMVAMLTDTKNKEDLIAIARERVLVNVLSSKAMSPELLKLVSIGLVGQCGELTRLHSEANQARVDQLRIAELDKDIKRAGGSGGLNRIQRIDEKVAFRNSRIVEAKKKMFVLDPDVRLYILGVIDSYKQELAKKNTAEGNALLTAVGELRSNPSMPITCGDLFQYTTAAFFVEAGKALEKAAKNGAEQVGEGVDWRELVRQVEYVLGTRVLTNSTGTDPVLTRGAEGKINEVIAAYLLQNTLVDTPHDRLHSQVFDRVTFSALESRNLFERVSESDGIAGFFHLSFFAATIPYIQGMLLYFLSMTFPFFALLLLIPSRASGALHWLGLWVWVKSWDVGFALVGVVREILWQHLGRGVAVSQSDIQWNDPSTVFAIMNRKDILASFGTFYSVSELLTISIPFITAHICLGADSFYSIFRGSIDKTGAMMRGRFNAGTRRADATSIDKKMAQDINNKSLAAIKEHAQRGWGTTSNGVLRILAGDGTLSRYIEGVAADAAFKAKFEQADYRVISGQNTTRTMTYGGGFHVLPLAARINLFQEPMTTRYFYQAPNLPIAGYPVSTNPGDGSTNLPRKNRSLIPGDSVDGW